jgi:hypothetical protein
MRRTLWAIPLLLASVALAQSNQAPSEQPTSKPTQGIFVPTTATLITELHLTKDDLLPVVAQVLSYFGLQHATGQVLSGEDLKNMVSSLDALWLVEYDITQRGVTVSDAVKMQQGLMEAQGWRRVFWNRSTKGDRETLVMIEPPRNGLFVVIARERPQALRVMVIRTKGQIDVNLALGLLVTFLMRPEQPTNVPLTPMPPTGTDKSGEKKETPEKPAPEKATPEKSMPDKTPSDKSPEKTPEKPSDKSSS